MGEKDEVEQIDFEGNGVEGVQKESNKNEKVENFKSSGDARRKSIKEKVVTAALIGGLLTGGCSVGRGPEEKKADPFIPDPVSEIIDLEDDITLNNEIEIEIKNVFPPLVETDTTYEINLSSNIKKYIDEIQSFEGESLKYPVFDTKEGQNHIEQVEKFVWSITGEEIKGQNPLPLNLSYTKWEVEDGFISYGGSGHFLEMKFENAKKIGDIRIEPENIENIGEGLQNLVTEFFPNQDLEHRIDKITKEGDYYRVGLSRLLNGVPIYQPEDPLYLVLSEAGEIKEARLWLREFKTIGEVSLLSGDEFTENINSDKYPKSISLTVPGIKGTGGIYGNFYPHHRSSHGYGVANLERVELVYYYRFFQENFLVLPMLRLEGEGFKDPEDGLHSTREKAFFDVLANALSSEHLER